MGLDMTFYSAPGDADGKTLLNELNKWYESGQEDDFESIHGLDEIACFSKHADLHGALKDIWRERFPSDDVEWDSFNDLYFEITQDMIPGLRRLARKAPCGERHGFFWGESDKSQWKRTLELLDRIEAVFAGGGKVFYYPNW